MSNGEISKSFKYLNRHLRTFSFLILEMKYWSYIILKMSLNDLNIVISSSLRSIYCKLSIDTLAIYYPFSVIDDI